MTIINHPILQVFTIGEPIKSLFQPKFIMFRSDDIMQPDHAWNMFHIKLTARAPDAYGERDVVEIECTNTFHMDDLYNERLLIDAMRAMLHNMLLHEADEAILVCGERKFDPHKREGYAPHRSP